MKYLVLLFLLPVIPAFAQVDSLSHQAIALKFIAAYNQQDYPKLFTIFPEQLTDLEPERKVDIEQSLKKDFTAQFADLGKIMIDSVYANKETQITVNYHFQHDPVVPCAIIMSFNKAGVMQGVFDKSPDYAYPKVNDNKMISLGARSRQIDSVIKDRFEKDKFNGNVLVIDDGRTIYDRCYGYSNFEKKIPLNNNSLFELASCSKQFTAMAIMMLAEAGKLNYSDSIQRFIPNLPYHNITIENLLTHTSGLPDYMQMMAEHWDASKVATNGDIVTLFKKYTPAVLFQPNEKYQYSNTGYALLSVKIEKASGMSYAEYLKKHIFQPLKMTRSRVFNTRRSKGETIDNYAFGYVFSDSLNKYILPDSSIDYDYVRFLDGITGDGSVNSTIVDLALWDKALRNNTLVKKETLEKAYSKHILNNGKESMYGFGEFIQNAPGSERIAYHSGGWPGYHTFIMHFIDQYKTIIILSNNEYSNLGKLANRIGLILTTPKPDIYIQMWPKDSHTH
jgi:CubicO group peptidase (beta-lactamase class C family)